MDVVTTEVNINIDNRNTYHFGDAQLEHLIGMFESAVDSMEYVITVICDAISIVYNRIIEAINNVAECLRPIFVELKKRYSYKPDEPLEPCKERFVGYLFRINSNNHIDSYTKFTGYNSVVHKQQKYIPYLARRY